MKKLSIVTLIVILVNFLVMYLAIMFVGAIYGFSGEPPRWMGWYVGISIALLPLAVVMVILAFGRRILKFIRDCKDDFNRE